MTTAMSEQFLTVNTDSSSHVRSSSFKSRPRPKLSLKIDSRPRSDSVPQILLSCADLDDENGGVDATAQEPGEGLCRVRSFKKTSKGVVNIGDKFKNKSTNSLKSTGSIKNLHEAGTERRPSRATSMTSVNSAASSAPSYFRVCVLGSDGVGKSTLIRQFMTSENLGPYGIEPKTPIGEPETTVSVLLDDEESVLEFVDNALMGEIENMKPDCFLVVFSLTDITTFEMARKLVRFIRTDLGNDRAIIMVANKTDLVRRRHISEHDAIAIASKYDCKYVEISIALNHRVDDLIVGILSQIRLRLKPDRDKSLERRKKSKPKRVMTNLFSKLFKVGLASETQRCEDLFS